MTTQAAKHGMEEYASLLPESMDLKWDGEEKVFRIFYTHNDIAFADIPMNDLLDAPDPPGYVKFVAERKARK